MLFLLTRTPINIMFQLHNLLKNPPLLFELTQVQSAISPNTFIAQDTGIYSQKELKHFWNHVLFTKHSDNSTPW